MSLCPTSRVISLRGLYADMRLMTSPGRRADAVDPRLSAHGGGLMPATVKILRAGLSQDARQNVEFRANFGACGAVFE